VPKVHFQSPLDEVTVEVPEGTTLLEAAEKAGAKVGHACGGVCACSTCHVWVQAGGQSLSDQDDAEMDRLDMAFDVRPASRLACQAHVGREDLEVQVTEESLNAYMDENPGERHQLEAEGKWPVK
jgi:2Fe-2S ferredoxin